MRKRLKVITEEKIGIYKPEIDFVFGDSPYGFSVSAQFSDLGKVTIYLSQLYCTGMTDEDITNQLTFVLSHEIIHKLLYEYISEDSCVAMDELEIKDCMDGIGSNGINKEMYFESLLKIIDPIKFS